jgi:hypothetical protein
LLSTMASSVSVSAAAARLPPGEIPRPGKLDSVREVQVRRVDRAPERAGMRRGIHPAVFPEDVEGIDAGGEPERGLPAAAGSRPQPSGGLDGGHCALLRVPFPQDRQRGPYALDEPWTQPSLHPNSGFPLKGRCDGRGKQERVEGLGKVAGSRSLGLEVELDGGAGRFLPGDCRRPTHAGSRDLETIVLDAQPAQV